MKLICALLSLLICCPLLATAQDIRDKVASAPTATRTINETIEPDSHMFGIPFGTTEDQIIAQYGKPAAYLRLDGTESGMLYGRSLCFLFTGGRLAGLRLTHNIVDSKLSNSLPAESPFTSTLQRWQLSNGITAKMSLADVRGILSDQLQGNRYHRSFETARARVELDFSHFVDQGDNDEAYTLFGVLIRAK